MVLFPIAFIWLLCVMVWLIRNSLNDGQPGTEEREHRRWRPRPPRRPHDRLPNGGRSRASAGASRPRD